MVLAVAGDMLKMAALSLSPFAFVVATNRVISSNRVLHFGLSSISMSIPQEYGDSAPIWSHLLAVISSCV
jgi:hypothetical protein